MAETKKQKRFVYDGFGFPVVLCNVTMIKVRGAWTPKVDYNKLGQDVLIELAHKPARLTGNEVRFIRHWFEMPLTQFGRRFSVSHPAVLKWEEAKDEATTMKWSVEKDIRLFILDALKVKDAMLAALYRDLRKEATAAGKPLEINILKAA
jgi:hypothetical protein